METRHSRDEDEDTEDVIDRLNELIELDFDAVRAYDQAIAKVDDEDARHDLEMCLLDHERHIDELTRIVRQLGGRPKTKGDLRGILMEGITALRAATGTVGALRAMRSNEQLTYLLYAKALQMPLMLHAREVVLANRDDEGRHLITIKAYLARLDDEFEDDVEGPEDLGRSGDERRPGAAY